MVFRDKIQQQKFTYYEVTVLGSNPIRLFYTPLQLNDLMHETNSIFEIILACSTAFTLCFLITMLRYVLFTINQLNLTMSLQYMNDKNILLYYKFEI